MCESASAIVASIAASETSPTSRPSASTTATLRNPKPSMRESASLSVVSGCTAASRQSTMVPAASGGVPAASTWQSTQPSRMPSSSVRYTKREPAHAPTTTPRAPSVVESTSVRIASATRARPRRLSARSLPMKSWTNLLAGWSSRASGVSYCSSCPARMSAMRSASLMASSTSCVTKMTVFFSSRWMRTNSAWSRSRVSGSTAPNGSSIRSSGGSAASARATPTR
jgi:hypothetical protein